MFHMNLTVLFKTKALAGRRFLFLFAQLLICLTFNGDESQNFDE